MSWELRNPVITKFKNFQYLRLRWKIILEGGHMEIDKTVVILGAILLVILGIFAISQLGSAGDSVSSGVGYASQYSGGGCGR